MEDIFGKTYNKKRMAPGAVTRVAANHLLHNCTTLGGSSGSVVLDLTTGEALGLHFSGSFLETNYAVRADVFEKALKRVKSGEVFAMPERPLRQHQLARSSIQAPRAQPQTATITVPLTITVSIGAPSEGATIRATTSLPDSDAGFDRPYVDDDVAPVEEGLPSDYANRGGYEPDFLGTGLQVPLPLVQAHEDDVLTFDLDGKAEHELRYEHFSVVMSESRRMCFFSAVNIDGNESKKSARVAWKWDPRIPKAKQIMQECYGNPPRFSRGHMTRREDPGWGSITSAKLGNEDSMHVTNVAPQMQAFNAPIGLALEDYALQHAREDAMRISVFTGPYFKPRDPVIYGVKIPLRFWKIIVFIHDDTQELCATGYEMDQTSVLPKKVPQEEFVFGQFHSPQLSKATQLCIQSIQDESGIDFNGLTAFDPLSRAEEGLATGQGRPALHVVEQIRFF